MKNQKDSLRLSLLFLIFSLCILAAGGAFGQPAKRAHAPPPERQPLDLNGYLVQVSNKHLGYKASVQNASAAKSYSGEGSLLLKPSLFGTGSNASDGFSNPFNSPNSETTSTYTLGISEQTNFGLSGKIDFNQSAMNIPTFGSVNMDWFQVEFTQSLLRNWGGEEARSQAELIQTTDMAKSFNETYMNKNLLLEAERNYWTLALARETVSVQRDALERAQRIDEWTDRRVRLQLADRSQGLQSSANLQARKLDYRNARDNESTAAIAFNSSRGVVSDQVSEKLVELTPELVASLKIPAHTQKRDDVAAAEFQAKATAANARLNREKDKPTVELFGVAPLTTPPPPSGLLGGVLPLNARPSTTIGLRFTAPLDLGTVNHAREGWAAEAQAADWTYQRKAFEEERDWQSLIIKFQQARARFQLYVDLEKQQKEKLSYERERQKLGKTTLEQVILFEADYEQAEYGRISTLADLVTLNAQMKLYGAL
jgi:outer membrane protein TolC